MSSVAALEIKRITGRQFLADLISSQVGNRSAEIC